MKKSNKDNLISFFQSDRAILMFCISIALIFWLLVKMSYSFKTEREISIEYDIPSGITFVESPPTSLKATIEGKGWDLMSHYFYHPQTVIQFKLPKQSSYTITRSDMKSKIAHEMPNLEVDEINYEFLLLKMENQSTKKVAIQLQAKIDFAAQHHLKDSIRLSPDSVLLSGPESLLAPIESWSTENIQLPNLRADLNPNIMLVVPKNPQIQLSPTSTTANIQVEQLTEKSLFAPIQIKNAPDSLAVFPKQVKVSCVVGLSKYETLSANDFILEVDLTGIPLNTNNNTLPISIRKQPDFVRGVKLSNQSVEFFFVESTPADSLNTL